MKRFLLIAVAAAGLLALPGSASAARSDCSYVTGGVPAGNSTVQVYTSGGTTPDSLVGACVDLNGQLSGGGFRFDGGTVEAGNGAPGTYAVVDGDNNNADPQGAGDGYVGLSNYENGTHESCPNPDQTDDGSGSNSGGCLSVRNGSTVLVSLPVPLVACGNTTGNDWEGPSLRDGCTLP